MKLQYKPLEVEKLPAGWLGIFKRIETTPLLPADDATRIRTMLGTVLQLETHKPRKNGPDEPVVAAGYQKAMWELKEGHLRYCPSQKRLYRRDPDLEDHPGNRWLKDSWHPVKSLEDEYSIPARDERPDFAATILRESTRDQWFEQVERGVRVGQNVWTRRDGKVVCVTDEPDLAVTQTFDAMVPPEVVDQAEHIIRWLTAGEESYRNLLRMFCTPWLEPFKQLTYVLSGTGGDGKTLIALQALFNTLGPNKVYPAFNTMQFCSTGGYSLAREGMVDAMDGMSFAYDDEAGSVGEDMLPWLRSLSTGAQMQARVVGGKYRTVTPTATIVLCTNQPFADSTENSDRRRFVKVQFHSSKGRSFDEYHAIELFIRKWPAALYVASCRLWEQLGDTPETVNLTPARAVTDEMYWVINEIVENKARTGQAVASRMDYRKEFHKAVDDGMMQLLGLVNATSTVLNGTQQRVMRVKDWERFTTYRDAVLDAEDQGPQMTPPPAPIEDAGMVEPSSFGFECDYVRADAHKVARQWKMQVESPNLDTTHIPEGEQTYAVVPREGYVVLDLDVPKTGGTTGWQLVSERVGSYGSQAFPTTYLVGTPSGGVHAYYKIPPALMGKLKNAAHPHTPDFPDGIPVDLRVDGKGYVIGAGSHVDGGDYRLLDMPASEVPELSYELCKWLTDTPGYRVDERPAIPMTGEQPSLAQLMRQPASSRGDNGPRPDMTPIPEGSRNTDLHAWAYGRAMNHPDNLRQIELDLYERARISGLPDSETQAMWNSILRQVRQHQ